MSVKINSADSARVLVGMPFINTVFLFVVSNNGSSISLASSGSNGQYVGCGKSVAWLTSSQAAVLVSTYSLEHSTWYSSNIYLYTSLTTTTIPSSYSSLIPNIQQQLPSTISSQLIQAVSTPESLAVLDVNGNILLILATPAGTYAATSVSSLSGTASIPMVSSSTACIAGTYKSSSGIHPCSLCPSGTRNPGGGPCISCINCSSNSFCSWSAVFEVNETYLTSQSQAYAYPRSPELTAYEDIILSNSFAIGSTSHCIVTSPLFWALIVGGVAESVGDSSFACDTTLRNAQYDSNLQSLAIPVPDEEQPIVDMLDNQVFTLQLDVFNTAISCQAVSFVEIVGSTTLSLPMASCNNVNGVVSATIILPGHDATIEVTLTSIQLVGGFRLGLSGPSQSNDSSTLQQLSF
ncbi:unnamed protein product [Rotaria socialis]|uniref:Uncharacterized protein n=1 Tax=Rotaria socialis TaxID=392032 RepID=A0A820YP09_9BILA|nr:unnamed protein product [Rotaria socialis]